MSALFVAPDPVLGPLSSRCVVRTVRTSSGGALREPCAICIPTAEFPPAHKTPRSLHTRPGQSLGLARVIRNLVNYNYSAGFFRTRRYLSIFAFSGSRLTRRGTTMSYEPTQPIRPPSQPQQDPELQQSPPAQQEPQSQQSPETRQEPQVSRARRPGRTRSGSRARGPGRSRSGNRRRSHRRTLRRSRLRNRPPRGSRRSSRPVAAGSAASPAVAAGPGWHQGGYPEATAAATAPAAPRPPLGHRPVHHHRAGDPAGDRQLRGQGDRRERHGGPVHGQRVPGQAVGQHRGVPVPHPGRRARTSRRS